MKVERTERPRRRNVSYRIEEPTYDASIELHPQNAVFSPRSLVKRIFMVLKAPFNAFGEARHYKQEIKRADSRFQKKETSATEIIKRLSADNVYWKLIYPLPINGDLERISVDLEAIKKRLKLYDTAKLRLLKVHAQGIESRYQVSWVVYAILLFAFALFGHNYISAPYFIGFFIAFMLLVLVLLIRYIRSRFLVTLVKELINQVLLEE